MSNFSQFAADVVRDLQSHRDHFFRSELPVISYGDVITDTGILGGTDLSTEQQDNVGAIGQWFDHTTERYETARIA